MDQCLSENFSSFGWVGDKSHVFGDISDVKKKKKKVSTEFSHGCNAPAQ